MFVPRKSILPQRQNDMVEPKNHQIVGGLEDISEWGENAKVF